MQVRPIERDQRARVRDEAQNALMRLAVPLVGLAANEGGVLEVQVNQVSPLDLVEVLGGMIPLSRYALIFD